MIEPRVLPPLAPPHRPERGTPGALASSFHRSRWLLSTLVRRDIATRYRGSYLGVLWAVAIPLLLLAVYAFVFREIVPARWRGGDVTGGDFALMLFAGLIVFNLLATCLVRAPTLVVANPSYVKKIRFPLELLAGVVVGGALFDFAIGYAILLVGAWIVHGSLSWLALIAPIAVVPIVGYALGATWILAALGVYVRDLGQLVGPLTMVLLFLSPVFYPIDAVPLAVRPYFAINPLAVSIDALRTMLFGGEHAVAANLTSFIIAVIFAWAGFALFQRARRGFADVL